MKKIFDIKTKTDKNEIPQNQGLIPLEFLNKFVYTTEKFSFVDMSLNRRGLKNKPQWAFKKHVSVFWFLVHACLYILLLFTFDHLFSVMRLARLCMLAIF